MKEIQAEIWEGHLSEYPDEIEVIAPFLFGFEITWAKYRFAYNTGLSLYFLKPNSAMIEMYGFRSEVALFYSAYNTLESRTIQAIEKFLGEEPAKGRVEKLNYILVSETKYVQQWLDSYTENIQEQPRIVIGFSASELRENQKDRWFVTNALSSQLYSRDLYDFKLPLVKDAYFFGRKVIIGSYLDAVKRSENRGLFGLRKTGKTSTLYRVKGLIEAEEIGNVFLYDCKDPSIRKLRWFQLIERICRDIGVRYNNKNLNSEVRNGRYDEVYASSTFSSVISKLKGKVIIIFDEIEYISFKATLDTHWKNDFIEFWQSFWACQSQFRNLVGIVAGVNPSIAEIDSVNGVQNPLFGIISHEFLKGFEFSEMREMVRELGSKMGLIFSEEALAYLYARYGGHPYLTRIACSLLNSKIKISQEKRPVTVTKERLLEEEEERDAALQHYCEHVVSELRQFYPDEYEMLELLATNQLKDFIDLSRDPSFTRHLQSYGLLLKDSINMPKIAIPVVGFYVGIKNARDEGRKTVSNIISANKRESWLRLSIHSIINDIRFLEKIIKEKRKPLLFGQNSFPEADNLSNVNVCTDIKSFENFINAANRCLVESIEVYGKASSDNNYFWGTIKTCYPHLFDALHRIKLYRHDCMHLELNTKVHENLLRFLKLDLEGRKPGEVEDLYFILQQCVLDKLWIGIQVEIDKLT
jgi:hypothetical protein